eukprot:CAMPEP_0182473944 /NCGR_PEP_ID=MMETSP1319-20130603/24799_1 /TAXON_ID=172717 /ORGANISM="Bolidomonas pacifica, Strain RCC208" /LENGTH=357 /DNA_ID=CAMNT_0024674795 /DNA_START=128 /DNA_END=1198 /DNA_ORIENTATION=+
MSALSSAENMRRPHSLAFEQDEHLPPTAPTAGYVLTTYQPPLTSFLTAYPMITSAVSTAFSDNLSKVYIYPEPALHITIATLHPFTSLPPSSPQTLQANLGTIDFPSLPFALKPMTINVGSKAIIVRFSDSSGMMSRLRASITKASYPQSRTPDIIHMTVARFTESFEMPNPNKLETLVSTAEQILSAVPETACYPRFVLEDRPYMHIADLEKNTLWRYSLPPLDRVLLGSSGGRDYYQILGCQRHDVNLKRAYYDLAKVLHPDKNQGSGLTEEQKLRWRDVQEAWGVLKDRRAAYDRCLLEQERNGSGPSGGGAQTAHVGMHENVHLVDGIEAEDEDGAPCLVYEWNCSRCGILNE